MSPTALDPKYFPSTQSSFCVIGIDPRSSLVSLCSPQKTQKKFLTASFHIRATTTYICSDGSGFVRVLYWFCKVFERVLYWFCMGFVRVLYRFCTGFVQVMYGFCTGLVWVLYEFCMSFV